jgi:hypothetical protein
MSYYAKNVYTATAGQTDFTAPAYRVPAEIKVYINGLLTTAWTWFSSSVIRLNSGATAGAYVVVQRETERASKLVEFQKGPIYSDDLNTANTQNIQNIQEMWDELADAITLNLEGKYDLDGKRLENVGDPIDNSDAITKGYLDNTYNANLNAAVAAAQLAETNAETAETNAETAEAKAEKWADETVNVEVEPGKYSAKHHRFYAEVAQTAAELAQGAAEAAQDAAEAAQAALSLPSIDSGDAGLSLRVNSAGSGYELFYPHRKNIVINGDFRFWQRGGTVTGLSGSGNITRPDRFKFYYGCGATFTLALASPPDLSVIGHRAQAALVVYPTVADTSIGSTEYAFITYPVEGYDFCRLVNQTVTLSFWAYAKKTGTYCVSFRNSGADRSYVVEYTIAQSLTWEYKTITLTMHDTTSGTWNYTTGVGLFISWAIAAGSSFHGTKGSWLSGNYYSTSNQVNGVDATNNDFGIYGVQLELGPVATAFESRHFAEEFALCQRYYEKSYNIADTPGTITTNGVIYAPASAYSTTSIDPGPFVKYRVAKRIVVAPTIYNHVTGGSASFRGGSAGAPQNGTPVLVSPSESGFGMYGTGFTGLTAGQAIAAWLHFTVDAEL